jgi:transcription initiation factor TFIIB
MRGYKRKLISKMNNNLVCCEKPHVVIKNGTNVCLNCGIVFGSELIQKERRAYTAEEFEKKRRTQLVLSDFGPRTVLPRSSKDYKGGEINAKKKSQISRLSKIQRSLISSIERNLWDAKPKMNLLATKLNIPKYVQETAWIIYIAVAKKKLTMGRSIESFVAASLYTAIRIHEIPRLLEEISDNCLVSRRKLTRALGILIKEILPELNLNYKPITPEQLIFRFGNDLKIPLEIQKRALRLYSNSTKNGLSSNGKDPKGFAASAIYMAAKPTEYRKTQTEVSDIAKITEVTLRTRINDIKAVSSVN